MMLVILMTAQIVQWSWFKTKEERDKEFNKLIKEERMKYSRYES